MLGERPRNGEFEKFFDWPDALTDLAYDAPDAERIVKDLDQQPERQARIRKLNIQQSLLRHDWVYRWEPMLKLVEVAPLPQVNARKEHLRRMAERVTEDQGTETAMGRGQDREVRSSNAEHRRSYWKTAVVSALFVLVGFAAMVYLVVEQISRQRPWSLVFILVWWAGGLILLLLETVTAFVLAGALISLRRDSLESRGLPYAGPPREWHGGFVVRSFRGLLRAIRALGESRPGQLDLRAGELVEIRSREEILATLDSRGERDSLPFMPEMEVSCGTSTRLPSGGQDI